MPPSSASQLKGGRNHISISYLSPQVDLGNIIGLDKPVGGTEWWTLDNTTKLWTIAGNLVADAVSVDDEAYGDDWNGSLEVPTKNAIYDKFTAIGAIEPGTYTPTVSTSSNVAAYTLAVCPYLRVGSIVLVSGFLGIDPVSGVPVILDINIPIASNLAALTDLNGAAYSDTAINGAAIYAETVNNNARFTFTPSVTVNSGYSFIFMYRILA